MADQDEATACGKPQALSPSCDSWAVLLEAFAELPHLDVAHELADILGVGVLETTARIRHQQGIVWEGLSEDIANELGSFLIGKGWPCGLVPQDEVVQLGRSRLSRRGEVTANGLVLEDMLNKPESFSPEGIAMIQAAWVEEKVEVDHNVKPSAFRDQWSGARDDIIGIGIKHREQKLEEMGWVLNVFPPGPRPDFVRVVGRYFNYEYQPQPVGNWSDRFLLMLDDIAKAFPPECLDRGFKAKLSGGSIPPEWAGYRSVHDMMERMRWQLTLKRVHPEGLQSP